jgi:hypothetical protein
MLSHEPKNYALLEYDGSLILRGVAFRSSRMEPFGAAFLRRAVGSLLRDDISGVRDAYLETVDALRAREISTFDVSSRVRLTKSPEEYLETRESRRELPYEAMLASNRPGWSVGDRVRVYRARHGTGRVVAGESGDASDDPRDYDIEWYVRLLRETFAARMVRAFTTDDFAIVFPHPDQLSLFAVDIGTVRSVLSYAANG